MNSSYTHYFHLRFWEYVSSSLDPASYEDFRWTKTLEEMAPTPVSKTLNQHALMQYIFNISKSFVNNMFSLLKLIVFKWIHWQLTVILFVYAHF